MFKDIFRHKELLAHIIKYLTHHCDEIDWHARLDFIYTKYFERDTDTNFDIHLLYLVTYSLRGHIKTRLSEFGVTDLISVLIMNELLPHVDKLVEHPIYIHAISPVIRDEYAIKYGTRIVNYIDLFVQHTVEFLTHSGISFKLIYEIKDIKDPKNAILLPYATILPAYKTNVSSADYYMVFAPIPFTKGEALVSNFMLNLLNCCYADTITDTKHPYTIVTYNSIEL